MPAFIHRVASAVAHFVAPEVGISVDAFSLFSPVATVRKGAAIAVLRMETVIYVAAELVRAVKPRTRANENAIRKPLGAVIAVGGAVVGRDVVVTVGTHGCRSDLDADLRLGYGRGYGETDSNNAVRPASRSPAMSR